MRISDWSSDVCSSDLDNPCSQRHVKQFTECYRQISDRARWRLLDKDVALRPVGKGMQHQVHGFLERHQESGHCRVRDAQISPRLDAIYAQGTDRAPREIGRAAGREGGWPYGETP